MPSCRTNAECPTAPGVCLATGACASESAVIHVEPRADGCPSADGSVAMPFCSISAALAALSPTRSTIVVMGEHPNFGWDYRTFPVTITSSQGGRIVTAPGFTGAAISVGGGNLTLREIEVTASLKGVEVQSDAANVSLIRVTVSSNDGTGSGVYVHNRAALQMDGCLVRDHAMGVWKGGDSGPTRIENSVLVANARGASIESSPFGASVFRNNTLIDNTVVGVECITASGGSAPEITGILAHGNGGGQIVCPGASDACTTVCSAADPKLDVGEERYRLTAASPSTCKDVLDSAPLTDRRGTPRPQGPKSDCGADEYTP